MKRYTVKDSKGKKVGEYETAEEYAAEFAIEATYVHSFLTKNTHNHLTFNGHSWMDNGPEIDAERQRTRDEKVRQEAYLEAKADLEKMANAAAKLDKAKTAPKPTVKKDV